MIFNVLSHTPVWVWGLLIALLALGFSQTRQRDLQPWRLLMLPLTLLGLGLWSMAPGFMAFPLSALVWVAALGVGVALLAGRPARAGTRWLPAEQRLRLPGSWMPMLLILATFLLRYAANVGMALNPGWRSAPWLLLPLALLYGGLSGIFLGRSVSLLRLSLCRTVPPVQQQSGECTGTRQQEQRCRAQCTPRSSSSFCRMRNRA
jgi:hypothetical protein